MRTRLTLLPCAAVAVAFSGPVLCLAQTARPLADPTPALTRGIDVLASGQVHEAYAQPVGLQPEPSPVVPKGPPAPIPEEPPDLRPEGDNIQWIGGYWAWDADRNEFIWISGTYRNAPPGQTYVPGYWENTPDGWRWVPGLWAPASQPDMPYLPQPPAPLETGPSIPPPDDNSFYTPGCWVFRETRYVWRPGFWQACRPGFVWVPPHYNWTPAGYLFVDGYWDYPLDDRGLLFAPVAFTQPLWQTPGWYYQPSYVVGYGPLLDSLFVRPGWGFYFGNYYGSRYLRAGYQPWYAFGPRYHDPLFSYYRWRNRGNPGWQAGLRQVYLNRVAGRAPLPPRTLAQQNSLRNASMAAVTPLSQFRSPNVRLTRVSASQLTMQRTAAQRLRQFGLARSRTEASLRGPRTATARSFPALRLSGPAAGGTRTVQAPSRMPVTRPAVRPASPSTLPRTPTAVQKQKTTVATPRTALNRTSVPGGTPRYYQPTPPRTTTPQPRVSQYRAGANPPRPTQITARTPTPQPRTVTTTQPRVQASRPQTVQSRPVQTTRYRAPAATSRPVASRPVQTQSRRAPTPPSRTRAKR
jgi:hypothetical protein